MDATYVNQYDQFERSHWWSVVRRELIVRHMLTFGCPNGPAKTRWLDVGCSGGVLMDSVPQITHKVGADMDPVMIATGQARGLDIRPIGTDWDFSNFGTFDLVTLCDVIEHVEDDQLAIDAVRKVLGDHGSVLITVPALMSLWSYHDVVNHHFRRYNRRRLLSLFPRDDWDVLTCSYFSSFLLPAIWGIRKIKGGRQPANGASHALDDIRPPHPIVNGTLKGLFRLEAQCMRVMEFPLGSSLIVVARKK